MSLFPQGPLPSSLHTIFYWCRHDPRVFVHKHRRWKWIGVTLNFARSQSYVVLLLTIFSAVLATLPGVCLARYNSLIGCLVFFGSLIVWTVLLCWYYYRQAELDLRQPNRHKTASRP